MAKLPLEGYRVADFSWVIAGPYGTQWLAVMGAEVIRIESNLHTDINRRLQPYVGGEAGINRSGLYNGLNLSKKSCTIDLTRPEGVDIAKRIVALSDIVVENFGHGIMERFGLGYAALRELKPDLILVSSSGFGKTGTLKAFTAYNEEFYTYGGLASLTGQIQGPPAYIGGIWADHVTGTHLALAILAALYHRTRTGEGQYIDMSMTEATIAQIPEAVMDYTMNRKVRGFSGNRDDAMAPHGCYPCLGEDRWVAIAVSSEDQWRALCKAMGDPEWTREKRFACLPERYKHQEELDRLLAEWTRKHTPSQVAEILQKAGIPAGPSLDVEGLVNDPHMKARGFYVSPEHAEVGKQVLGGVPWKISDCPPKVEAAPVLGQHNEYVFLELLGMSDEEFARLAGEQIIY